MLDPWRRHDGQQEEMIAWIEIKVDTGLRGEAQDGGGGEVGLSSFSL